MSIVHCSLSFTNPWEGLQMYLHGIGILSCSASSGRRETAQHSFQVSSLEYWNRCEIYLQICTFQDLNGIVFQSTSIDKQDRTTTSFENWSSLMRNGFKRQRINLEEQRDYVQRLQAPTTSRRNRATMSEGDGLIEKKSTWYKPRRSTEIKSGHSHHPLSNNGQPRTLRLTKWQ